MARKRGDSPALTLAAAVAVAVGSVVAGIKRLRAPAPEATVAERPPQPVGAFDPHAIGIEAPSTGGPKGRMLRLAERRRWRWLGRLLQVHQRFSALHGGDLAAAVTLNMFVALFPLLLLAVAVVGYIASSGTDVAGRIISELGLTGQAAHMVREALSAAEGSRRTTTVIGLLGLAWSSLGLVGSLQFAYNQVWQVEGRGIKDKAVGIMWLCSAGVLFLASALLTTAVRWLPGFLAPLGIGVSIGATFVLWAWTEKSLPNVKLSWRDVLGGAAVGALGLEALKLIGSQLVPMMVASSSQLYGTIGVVFAVLAWLLFFGKLLLYAAVLNVVLYEARHGKVSTTIDVPAHPTATAAAKATRSDSSTMVGHEHEPVAIPAVSGRR